MSESFGVTDGGESVERVTIEGGGLSAKVMTWGAVIQELRIEGHPHPLVLGFESFEHYPVHSPYFGAIAGRVANRIGNARFELDGRTVEIDANQDGKHQLHGGRAGFGRRVWRVADTGPSHVSLELVSRDGDMGYPGTLVAQCTYRLCDAGTLRIELRAETDAPTLCNLTNHSYFNLDGGADILDHTLRITSDRITELGSELIPTGRVLDVTGTPFDFREERPIRTLVNGERFRYDVNYCLGSTSGPLRAVAWARGATSGVAMEARTTEPGIQLYDGAKMSIPVSGLDGASYGAAAGFCLETQRWPDAPNHDDFPSAVLRPGESYEHLTEYEFTIEGS